MTMHLDGWMNSCLSNFSWYWIASDQRCGDNYGSFSSCELSDALIKLGVRHGGHIPDIVCQLDNHFVAVRGPAYTVQMVKASDTNAPTLESHFVDTVVKGAVVVIDAPRDLPNAVWGGLMTAGAQVRGAKGVVISGRCRDVRESAAVDFPVFARGRSTLGQGGFTRAAAVQVPLAISSVGESDAIVVRPGDYIVGDCDGVVCIPAELVGEVAKLAEKGREVDEKCMEDIRKGLGVQASFKKYRGK